MASIKSMKADAARKRALAASIDETQRAKDLRREAESADKRASHLRKQSEDPMEAVFGVIGFVVLVAVGIGYFAS